MSDKPQISPEKEDPQKMELRASPDPVTRLSKKAIVIGAGAGAVLLSCAFAVALQPPTARGDQEPKELYNVTRKPVLDQLADLPKSYSDMSVEEPISLGNSGAQPDLLGDAMLGDIGRAVYLAEARAAGTATTSSNNALQARAPVNHGLLEARRSDLFFSSSRSPQRVSNSETEQLAALLGGEAPKSTKPSIGGYRITAGTLIPASLVTGINSDLPGPAIARVTQNVYDSLTGDHLLIPQGAKLIGSYNSDVDFGQARAFITWSRLINPDGSSINLDQLTASDLSGYSGLKDRVDHHTGAVIKAGILSTVLGVGAELSQDTSDDDVADAIRDAIQGTTNTAGQRIIQRSLSRKPTIKIRPGWTFQVIATGDLNLAAYRG